MSDLVKNMKDKLNTVTVDRDELNQVLKDRLDFGFDSIYFRYSEAIDELAYYKEIESRRLGERFDKKRFCDGRKMHFYNCLEQLLQAHKQE